MTTVQAAMSGVPLDLLTAVTTGTGVAVAIPSSFRHHNIIVTGASGVTSGAVTIETSNDADDTKVWAVVIMEGSVANPITVTTADLLMTHTGLLNIIRARVSTIVAGGGSPSVTVTYEGAKSY